MRCEIKFNDLLEFSEQDNVLTISGRAWKGLVVPNKKVLLSSEKEISNISKTLKGVPLQADHSKSVKDTVGKVFESTQDGDSVLYRAKVHDKEISEKIKNGLIGQCSVSLAADKIIEDYEYQGEKGWTALTGVSVIELSLVLRGAVDGNSVYPEFEFSIIDETDSAEPDPETISCDYNLTLENLAISAYEQLQEKYKIVENLANETLCRNVELNKENQTLKKQLEYLRTYGVEIPEKYLVFDLETLLIYGELISEARNATKTLGAVQNGEDYTDPKLEAKEALKDMIFDRDNPKKDIRTFSDWQKKYGNLGDFK